MMAGKVVGLEFEIMSKLETYFLMTVLSVKKYEFISISTHGFKFQTGPLHCNYQNVQWATFSQIEIKKMENIIEKPQTPLL